MAPADSVRRLEMQDFDTPAETSFTMGKELKEFQLGDSRRRSKIMSLNCSMLDVHFWGWKGV